MSTGRAPEGLKADRDKAIIAQGGDPNPAPAKVEAPTPPELPPQAGDIVAEEETTKSEAELAWEQLPDEELTTLAAKKLSKYDKRWKRETLIAALVEEGLVP